MNLRPQHRSRRPFALRFVLLRGGLLFVALLGAAYLWSAPLRGVLHTVAAPIWRIENWGVSGARSLGEHFRSKATLIAENERLHAELDTLSVRLLDRNELYEENLALKELLGRDASVNVVLGIVLARPPRSAYDTLLLDVGDEEGVRKGNYIAAGDTLIVGVIEHTAPHTSVARLFSSPGERIEVLLGESQAAIEAVGKGAGNFEAKVPVGLPVATGTPVFIPAIMPHVFAVVEDIEAGENDSFQRILFRSPINPFELRQVSVLRDETGP